MSPVYGERCASSKERAFRVCGTRLHDLSRAVASVALRPFNAESRPYGEGRPMTFYLAERDSLANRRIAVQREIRFDRFRHASRRRCLHVASNVTGFRNKVARDREQTHARTHTLTHTRTHTLKVIWREARGLCPNCELSKTRASLSLHDRIFEGVTVTCSNLNRPLPPPPCRNDPRVDQKSFVFIRGFCTARR